MANSDNVLRCGLTPKHVDVPELLRVLDFAPRPADAAVAARGRVRSRRSRRRSTSAWPAAPSATRRGSARGRRLGAARPGRQGPRIVVAVHGAVRCARRAGGQERVAARGAALDPGVRRPGDDRRRSSARRWRSSPPDGLEPPGLSRSRRTPHPAPVPPLEAPVSASGGGKAIVAALAANAGIAVAKFIGFFDHRLVVDARRGRALGGRHEQPGAPAVRAQARRGGRPTSEHPFGYGRDRFFYSFIVALMIFSLGSVFALYEGIHKLGGLRGPHQPVRRRGHPRRRDRPGDLQLPHRHQGVAGAQGRPVVVAASSGTSVNPELPVVLLEDLGALVGLVLALAGVGLAVLTGDVIWDAVGTICIGVLLGVIAVILIVETKSLLIGEGVAPPTVRTITRCAGRRARRAGDPPAHPVPRPRGAAGRREDRGLARRCRPRRSPRPSTTPRRACARRCPRPGWSTSSPTSTAPAAPRSTRHSTRRRTATG